MLQRLRESLTLVLIAALPFHALAVTWATYSLSGPEQAPFAAIAIWKEVLLLFIVFLALVELPRRPRFIDLLDGLIVLGIIVAIAVSLGHTSTEDGAKQFFLGFKYDFLPLVAFLILRRVSWSSSFFDSAMRVVILIGGIVAVLGLLSLWVPLPFFTAIGYSDLHSMYRPGAPLAAFQFLEGTDIRRIQSVMSGPNQLGLWLLLPWSIALSRIFRKKIDNGQWTMDNGRFQLSIVNCQFLADFLYLLLISAALYLTYSRSAWIAAGAILFAFAWISMQRRSLPVPGLRARQGLEWLVYWFTSLLVCVGVGIVIAPQLFVRMQSLKGHFEKPLEAIQMIREHPFGLGLGSAGPASNRLRDTCLFFESGADTAWAEGRTDICIFVGGEQKLPAGKTCDCPLLTENWYLQWGVEMGVIGLLISLLIPILVLWKWQMENGKLQIESVISDRSVPIMLAFFGISIAGLFLHSFEDSAVAYTAWILLAATGFRFFASRDTGAEV